MSSLSEAWSDMVRRWFPYFASEDSWSKEEEYSPRGDETFAAPCSVYEPERSAPRTAGGLPTGYRSFASPEDEYNASVMQQSMINYEGGSVMQQSYINYEGGSVQSSIATSQMMQRPSFIDASPAPFADLHIPFKDGSSQILVRPKFGGTQEDRQQMNLRGGSFLATSAYMARESHFFLSDPEDIVDVQVGKYFEDRPDVYLRTRLTRLRQGVYSMHGRQLQVEWDESAGKKGKGALLVTDAFAERVLFDDYLGEYVTTKDTASQYVSGGGSVFQAKSNLQTIPQECRMTFVDSGSHYSRLDAMKVANKQAHIREVAATAMTKGQGQVHVDRLIRDIKKLGETKQQAETSMSSLPSARSVRYSPPTARGSRSPQLGSPTPRPGTSSCSLRISPPRPGMSSGYRPEPR